MVLYVSALSPITAAGFAVMGRSCKEEAEEKEKWGFNRAEAHEIDVLLKDF